MPAAAQTPLTPARAAPRDRVRLLVADSDDFMRTTLACLLQRAGYAVQTAATTEDAVLAGERESWDCVVLDLDLPATGGIDLYSRLLFQGGARIPAVFLVNQPTATLELGLRHAHWIRLLRRPCMFSDLLAALEQCLRAPRTP